MLQRIQQQDRIIEQMNKKLSAIEDPSTQKHSDPHPAETTSNLPASAAFKQGMQNALGKLHLSGEGAVALFHHQSEGKFPNAEMRIDEAKLFLEAPVWNDVYLFTELNLTRRQDPSDLLNVGELYLDFENLSRFWNHDGQLGIRVGRFDIPFGEEYLTRDAIDNPLVSSSLMDFWGVDEGIEAYGKFGKFNYVLALQNGGHPSLRDHTVDKALALRIGYDPASWLHLGASAMRTGDLDPEGDQLSELWFGDGFIRSLSTNANTSAFRANVVQGEAKVLWKQGYATGAAGYLRYTDNDPAANNSRDVKFFSFEVLQNVTRKLYGAARFSRIMADKGFPLVGDANFGEYFFEELTEDLWRLSMGIGYRFSPNLLVKAEYSINRGKEFRGPARTHENLFALQAAVRF